MSAHFSVMKTVTPVILISLVGCNGGDDSGSESTDTTGTDITNQMFTNRSGDCAEIGRASCRERVCMFV